MSYTCDVCFKEYPGDENGEPMNTLEITLNKKPYGPNEGKWKLCSPACVHRAFKECASKVPLPGQL